MKRFAYLAAFVAAFSLTITVAPAPRLRGEPAALAQVMNAKCKVTATNPSTGTTGSDADCVWAASQPILIQCDAAVFITWDNSTPDTDSVKIAVGDPYPLRPPTASTVNPIKFLPVTGTANCNFYWATVP